MRLRGRKGQHPTRADQPVPPTTLPEEGPGRIARPAGTAEPSTARKRVGGMRGRSGESTAVRQRVACASENKEVSESMIRNGWVRVGLLLAASGGAALAEGAPAITADDQMMLAPFAAQRANFFHAALGVPRLESAASWLSPGETWIRARSEESYNEKGDPPDKHSVQNEVRAGRRVPDSFLGQFNTWLGLEVTHGLMPWLEIGMRVAYAGWDEHNDHFYFFGEDGKPLVRDEDQDIYGLGPSGRDDDLSDAVLRAKARLYEAADRTETLSLGCQVKLPLGQPRNLVDAGTTDVGVGLLSTTVLGPFAVHVNAGGVLPLGEQNLFEEDADVELNAFLCGGIGVVYRWSPTFALGVQLEGNTSAFRDVDYLDADPVTLLGGVRKLLGDYLVEAGVGFGLVREESYDYSWFLGVGRGF